MPTALESFNAKVDRYLVQPLEERLRRLAATSAELEDAVQDLDDAALSKRPQPASWSAKEILCHLRDVEELVIMRFHLMLASDCPRVFVMAIPPRNPELWGIDQQVPYPGDQNRWAEERQYPRNDAGLALSAFRRRRQEVLTFLSRLTPAQWERTCIFPDDQRVNFIRWTAAMAVHDDDHVAQVKRALGRA